MDTFIVRVYRSEPDVLPEDGLRGVVEEISAGSQVTFHDTRQLLAILRHRQHDERPVLPRRGETSARPRI